MTQHRNDSELELTALTADVLDIVRPWGSTRQLVLNRPATVKCISLAPQQRVSLQTHEHRSELWHILDGPMMVQVGDEEWLAQLDELVAIPVGVAHRIANPGTEQRRFLEVCLGT